MEISTDLPMRTGLPVALLALCLSITAFAQSDTLVWEDFNGCSRPAGWQFDIDGNQNAVWYIGTPQNPSSDGSSIDGTCMLIIDDDATGDQTPGFIFTASTPVFNGAGYKDLIFRADVHFRNAGEVLRILVDNGGTISEIARFEGRNYSGEQFSQYVTFEADLSFFASDKMQIHFEYNDNNVWAWWAGIDNVLVTGSGTGSLVLAETFNDCTRPADWSVVAEKGQFNWQFGKVNNPKSGTNMSMNGSCFAYFDDDGVGETAAPSRVALISPSFDMASFRNYELSFDLIYRTYGQTESVEVGVLQNGVYRPVTATSAQVGGDNFNVYEQIRLDLSTFKGPDTRLVFTYDDGGGWNWWVGIDNVKLVGDGHINDFCDKAQPLAAGDACSEFDLTIAYASPDVPSQCAANATAALWYSFTLNEPATLAVELQTNFNDIVELYKGPSCTSLLPAGCTDRDEFGFHGEKWIQHLSPGQYFVRVNGQQAEFGLDKGQGCIRLRDNATVPSLPANNICLDAVTLVPDAPCTKATNLWAGYSGIEPSFNKRSRADLWYTFTAGDGRPLLVQTRADFSESITIYEGGCGQLSEVGGTENGQSYLFEKPEAGKTYYLQISGYFSTLEGTLCPGIETKTIPEPYDDCAGALQAQVGAACVAASNLGTGFSGIIPPCDPLATADIWFHFTAPASGGIYLRNKADFISSLTVYSGTCSQPEAVYCTAAAHHCDGYQRITGLTPGKRYYIQISSSGWHTTRNQGNVCLELRDGATVPDWSGPELRVSGICVSKDAALLQAEASGGAGGYTFYGEGIEAPVFSGASYTVEVRDADGCIDLATGVAPDCSQTACNVFFEGAITQQIDCHGAQSGAITLTGAGGLAPYEAIWSHQAAGLLAGQLAAGSYSVTVSDQAGCSQELVFVLTEPEALEVTTGSFTPSAPEGGSIALTVTGGTAPYTFEWFLDGASYTNGSPQLTQLGPGFYHAIITDTHGCSVVSDSFEVLLHTSVQTEALPSGFTFYPNPASREIMLSFKANFQGMWQYSILSLNGVELRSGRIDLSQSLKHRVDVSGLPTGSYVLRMSQDTRTFHTIFIKTE